MDAVFRERLRKAGARFDSTGGHPSVVSFGDPSLEAAAALEGCVLADRTALGRVRMLGKDRQDLLHRLSTNDINVLKPGEGALTVLLTVKGRIVDLVHALAGEEDLLVVSSVGNGEKIRVWIDTFLFREEVTLHDASEEACLGLYGPGAAEILGRLTGGADFTNLPLAHHRSARLAGIDLHVARTFPLAGSGYLLLCGAGKTSLLWDALRAEEVTPAGTEALDRLRVAAGVPELGKELSEDYNPWEARLDRAINLSKGCYLGQEVVARLNTYQKVQRRLAGFEVGGSVLPLPGAPIFASGEEIGQVTSAALSPSTGRPLALGLIRVAHARPGEEVTLGAAESSSPARVVATPFGGVAGAPSGPPFSPQG